jgi:membrane protein implicated in regulation of membrane protease activity
MSTGVNWFLIVAGAVLILVEVLLGAASGFDFLLIGSAVLLGGALGLGVSSTPVGLATAGVLSLLYVFVGRRRIRGRLRRPGIPSNTDALLGREVMVVEAITAERAGRIKVEGEEWRALVDGPPPEPTPPSPKTGQEPVAVGSKVRVSRVDGVTVYVVPVEGHSPEGRSQS